MSPIVITGQGNLPTAQIASKCIPNREHSSRSVGTTRLSDSDREITDIIIRRTAKRFIRRYGRRFDDFEDLCQDLWLRFLTRLKSFNPAKASFQTFANMAIANAAIDLRRHRLARKRNLRNVSTVNVDRKWNNLSTFAVYHELDVRRGSETPDEHDRIVLRLDVAAILATLSPDVRAWIELLKIQSLAEVARSTKLPHSTIRYRLDHQKGRFTKATVIVT